MHGQSNAPGDRGLGPDAGLTPLQYSESGRIPRQQDSDLRRTASGRLQTPSGRLQPAMGPWRPSDHVTAFTEDDFEERVLQAERPVIVDFWADTCVPCRLQEPALEALAAELKGQVRFGRVNVYDNPKIPHTYRILGVPHLLLLVRGEVVMELVGDHSLDQLRRRVAEALAEHA